MEYYIHSPPRSIQINENQEPLHYRINFLIWDPEKSQRHDIDV